jgi:hypothetical protein
MGDCLPDKWGGVRHGCDMLGSKWMQVNELRCVGIPNPAQVPINADCGEVNFERRRAAEPDARRIGSLFRERDYTGKWTGRLRVPTTGLLTRDNFQLARHSSEIGATHQDSNFARR